jgi:RAD50-interacting protein 1
MDQQVDIALPQTLLGPVALLSADLKLIRSILPRTTLLTIYRRIASRLSEHIFHREILYCGRGQLSLSRGQAIAAECELWVETCNVALAGAVSDLGRERIENPWRGLLTAGRLVGLDDDSWKEVVDVTSRMSNDDEWKAVLDAIVGFCDLSREVVQQVLYTRRVSRF